MLHRPLFFPLPPVKNVHLNDVKQKSFFIFSSTAFPGIIALFGQTVTMILQAVILYFGKIVREYFSKHIQLKSIFDELKKFQSK